MTQHDFPAAGPIGVRAATRSSDLTVVAGQVDRVTVRLEPTRADDDGTALAESTRVELTGDTLRIEVPPSRTRLFGPAARLRIDVHVPAGSSIDVTTGAGDVRTSGTLAVALVRSGSGDVDLDDVGEADLGTGSGDVTVTSLGTGQVTTGSGDATIGTVRRFLRSRSGSGDVVVGTAADLESVTGSGDLMVKELDGRALVRTASGDLTVRRAVRGDLEAQTASGDVSVRVAEGTPVLLDCSTVTGGLRSGLEPAPEPAPGEPALTLRARTVSGDITVQRTS